MSILQVNELGEMLYCVCIEIWSSRSKSWTAKTEYLHAKDAGEAKAKIAFVYAKLTTRFVGIAPAIGFRVLDNHGEKLLA